MSVDLITRRRFCQASAAAFAASRLAFAQGANQSAQNPMRPDIAAIDRGRILSAATAALSDPILPISRIPAPNAPGTSHDYVSNPTPDDGSPHSTPPPFTGHRDALYALGQRTNALASASFLTSDVKFATSAATHLRAWFITPETRLTPRLDYAHLPMSASPPPARPAGAYTGIVETLPLVEIVRAIPFLAASGALTQADLAGLQDWFSQYLRWLTAEEDSGPRLPAVARDSKDHNATSWLVQVAAYTLFTLPYSAAPREEDHSMTELRRRLRTTIIRNQITADGVFRNEVATANPYRNSLFNLDLLACACVLLSTRFESPWEYALEDGPGIRATVSYHWPFLVAREKWPFRADAAFFRELPARRASMLFAGRAYHRPEYVALWETLDPAPAAEAILRTMPARLPLFWVMPPPRIPREG